MKTAVPSQLEPLTVTTESGIRIHHLQTGMVAVKRAHRNFRGIDGTGLLAIAADPRWTEWMPISVWVIEHPEGIVVVDTGENIRSVTDKDYFNCDPGTNFFYRSFLRLYITPEEEIGAQLLKLGIPPKDVRWVVQTHLHGDHVGGLRHFHKSQIILSGLDYPNSVGTLPCNYPSWLSPTLARFDGMSVPGFGQVMPLSNDGRLFIVPTPGHTAGHQSVVLVDSGISYFFAGDTSFTEAQMKAVGTAGIAVNPSQMRKTLGNIQQYAKSNPTVYMPSHDHDIRLRLENCLTVKV